MMIKYNININNDSVMVNLKRITNQIYKLLPNREEGIDWEKPLSTLIEELVGMNELLLNQHTILFSLLCKLEGLFFLKSEKDFFLFRRTIFECLGLMNDLVNNIKLKEV